MPLILPGNVASALPTGYEVANSCRFDDGSSDNIQRTYGTPTNSKIFALSWWVKLSADPTTGAAGHDLWGERADKDNRVFMNFNGTGQFDFFEKSGGSNVLELKTNRLFRDVGAWYHVLLLGDSTQGTASNRIKLYINGVQETSFATETYPAEDYDFRLAINTTKYFARTGLGGSGLSTNYYEGYLAEVAFVDGTVTAHTDYGEFDEDSPTIWKPKDVSGLTFGDNGFYLDFEDSSALGNDVSGNDNDFTVNNLTSVDQCVDSPTNNFCTMSPLWNFANNVTLSEGNCKIVSSGSWSGAGATIGLTAGKWYYEVKMTTLPGGGGNGRIGFFDSEVTHTSGNIFQQTNGATYFYNNDGGETQIDNSITTADYGEVAQGGILGVALNMDDKQVTFYDDNVAIITNLALSTNGTSGIVIPSSAINTETQEYNFGNPPYSLTSAASDENGYGNFEFAPPSGYLAICSKNLGSDGG